MIYISKLTKLEYDENKNLIHYHYDNIFKEKPYEIWFKYDENNVLINYKCSDGFEKEFTYNKNNKVECSKFITNDNTRMIITWFEYDSNKNLVHQWDIDGNEQIWEYDENGNNTYHKISEYSEEWFKYDDMHRQIYHKTETTEFYSSDEFIYEENEVITTIHEKYRTYN